MRLTVKIEGAELVRKGLQDLSAEIPKIGRQQIRTMMERVKRRMQEYPPEPAGQSVASSHAVLGRTYRRAKGRYQRTGNLGGHWAIIEQGGIGYVIENTAQRKGRQYGQYVVGRGDGTGQAWMHKGRWQLLRTVVDEETKKLPAEIEKHIAMVARKVGV